MMIEAPEACRPGSQHITHSFCIHSPSSPGCGITNTGVCASVRSLVTRYRVLLQPRCWCHKCRLMSPLSCSARRRDTPGMRGATWGAAQPPEPETRRLRHSDTSDTASYHLIAARVILLSPGRQIALSRAWTAACTSPAFQQVKLQRFTCAFYSHNNFKRNTNYNNSMNWNKH